MTTALPPVKPLIFHLKYRKIAAPYQRPKVGQQWDKEEYGERDQARYDSLPETPPGFLLSNGYFPVVSSRADFLNLQQQRAGFVDYSFWPEAVPTEPDPNHCEICKHIRTDRDL